MSDTIYIIGIYQYTQSSRPYDLTKIGEVFVTEERIDELEEQNELEAMRVAIAEQIGDKWMQYWSEPEEAGEHAIAVVWDSYEDYLTWNENVPLSED